MGSSYSFKLKHYLRQNSQKLNCQIDLRSNVIETLPQINWLTTFENPKKIVGTTSIERRGLYTKAVRVASQKSLAKAVSFKSSFSLLSNDVVPDTAVKFRARSLLGPNLFSE